ncbi:GMC family oxidoreductase [Jannaschia sp. S6380]|uniref:FAD-dependent oxidoreductase n=1 Tax=Jannaschia sp. S6380 TaxID=2926408 RepID=UPI001FF1796A|nr:GMC family oxidoreductase [Jannaschia sp. S6380]MCK0167448.1 GMC family oxidoreductase [Jannaschia sp. S6380]
MILNARQLPDGEVVEADICIVGGGPAGITLALELSESGREVLLLESGDMFADDATQALYEGPDLGFPYTPLAEARLRFLGGSSNHWSGYCMRYTPLDFEARDWIPHSGWPIGFADLEPYYERAHPYFELQTERPYDFEFWAARIGGDRLAPDPEQLENLVTVLSPPTAFGYVYEDRLRAAPDVRVLLNANVTELETDDNAARVTALRVACIDGPRFDVRARNVVLAAGGIEIPRLLFNSDRVMPMGLGNGRDLVGRFFNDHVGLRPHVRTLMSREDLDRLSLYTGPHYLEVGGIQNVLAASEAHLRREKVGNFIFHLFPDGGSPGKRAIRQLFGALKTGEAPPYLSGEIMNLMTDLDGATNAVAREILGRRDDLIDHAWLGPWLSMECIPNPDSRVLRIEETDRFGKRRVGLDWQLTEFDRRTARHAAGVLIDEMGRMGLGRSWSYARREDYEIPRTVGLGKHHNGTVRMSDDPATGVVDANCKVHGVANLHIASCGVFPTSGYANPTLTIGAMAIRLADHLRDATPGGGR